MSEVLFASMVSLGMVLTTVTLHYWTLAGLSALLKRWSDFRGEILLVVMVMFVAHMEPGRCGRWQFPGSPVFFHRLLHLTGPW